MRLRLLRRWAAYLFSIPHLHMLSMIGSRERPFSEKLYSTFGGICGYSLRMTRPSAAISFNSALRVLYVIVPIFRCQFIETDGVVLSKPAGDHQTPFPADHG